MKTRSPFLALAALALFVGLLFIQEPGFGDDFTYWSFGLDLHQRGLKAWQENSFHDLRWPVWGGCWMLQEIGGVGLIAYYGVPILYLALGAGLSFIFARRLAAQAGSELPARSLGWAAATAFLFHPLLDTVCYRPMPDLSEAVWGGVVMLLWWALMQAEKRGRQLLFALLTGLAIFVLESNRLTGVFIIPVLLGATLWLFPRRFGWLALAGVFAALCYAAECAFYHSLFGDWLHSLHANLGAKGRKGTETIPIWYLPFRFFDALWNGSVLAPLYCLLALLGGWTAWRQFGKAGRLLVILFMGLYLEYGCAPQSLWPYQPLLRDADRFLAGLTIPFSTLAALGAFTLWKILRHHPRTQHSACVNWLASRPWVLAGLAAVLLLAGTSRPFFNLGFVPAMRSYLAALPAGTHIFSHSGMREMAYLVNAKAAHHFKWTAPDSILHRSAKLEAAAAEAAEFWYVRKLVWLGTSKKLESKKLTRQEPLGSYFDTPERDWVLTELFAKGNNPDLVFYRRRPPVSPPAEVYLSSAPEIQAISSALPALPVIWDRHRNPRVVAATWQVPAAWRGRLVRLEMQGASDRVEGVTIMLNFAAPHWWRKSTEFLLKPYFYPDGGKDFFVIAIPADATTCEITLKFAKETKQVAIRAFRLLLEPSAAK